VCQFSKMAVEAVPEPFSAMLRKLSPYSGILYL
jgi:hypothetical protein